MQVSYVSQTNYNIGTNYLSQSKKKSKNQSEVSFGKLCMTKEVNKILASAIGEDAKILDFVKKIYENQQNNFKYIIQLKMNGEDVIGVIKRKNGAFKEEYTTKKYGVLSLLEHVNFMADYYAGRKTTDIKLFGNTTTTHGTVSKKQIKKLLDKIPTINQ